MDSKLHLRRRLLDHTGQGAGAAFEQFGSLVADSLGAVVTIG